MNNILKKFFLLWQLITAGMAVYGQQESVLSDAVFSKNIKSVQLFIDPLLFTDPVIALNTKSQLHLKFDDLEGDRKNYYYTLIHCNYDWTQSDLLPFDYLDGFEEQEISDSKFSFNTDQTYTHYDLLIPNDRIRITKSGNYIIKVYLNNDQQQLVITRRFMVVDSRVKIASEVKMEGDFRHREDKHRINFSINHHGLSVNNPVSEFKVMLMQNFRWDNIIWNVQPQFLKPEQLDYYSATSTSFEPGKEFRNFDTRTIKYNTERVASIISGSHSTLVKLLPDEIRNGQQSFSHRDNNGKYFPGILDYFDQDAQPDYVFVQFSLPVDYPVKGGKIFLMGQFTGWQMLDEFRMRYNSKTASYELSAYLKQGYYEYIYYFKPDDEEENFDSLLMEGNDQETENTYQILVYYRPFGSRYDQLIGYKSTDSYNR